jgi:anthranilate phosphoribosyltransferase
MALFCGHQKDGIAKAMDRASESLKSGKALNAFKKLMENS